MNDIMTKLLQLLPPEAAHDAAIKLLRKTPDCLLEDSLKSIDLSLFSQNIKGLNFIHPIGLAAGFDKQAEVFDKLEKLGFSHIEAGSVTPLPQPGNPKPRLFRLNDQKAIINAYGFNSVGLKIMAENIQKRSHQYPLGINLGKNKDSVTPAEDFIKGAKALLFLADYFTVNLSSPNTPGLRDLQQKDAVLPILEGIREIMHDNNRVIPLFIKLSPDMERKSEQSLVEFLIEKNIDGIIVSNTTLSREGVESNPLKTKPGGLSGKPLKNRSTEMLKRVYDITQGQCVLMGCGGVSSGQDVYDKLCAGANLVQIYTSFIYEGPKILQKILTELSQIFNRHGIRHISEILKS